MGALADTLGNRVAGDLIRAEDWNALIAGVENADQALQTQITDLGTQLDTRIGAVEDRVTALETQASQLDERVTTTEAALSTLQGVVDTLRGQFRRVTMQTDRLHFAIGEIAEITARITDLGGAPLTFADAATRPWIDFVAVWGQLKPVPGFEALGGAGDRTISVRVDANGVARVRLRAEHSQGLTDEVESEVQTSLGTVLQSTNTSIAQTILAAATPQEAVQRGAFHVITGEYDRTDATSVRTFADAYYLRNPIDISGKIAPIFQHSWQDYRATVLAFGKNDSDPQTPDASIGVCSIQLTFRDWIGPWLHLDYISGADALAAGYGARLAGRIDGDLAASVSRLKSEVDGIVLNKGVIAKQRDLQAIRHAVGQMEVTNPPPFLSRLKDSMRDGVAMQQVLEFSQATSLGDSAPTTAFSAFTDSSSRVDTQAEAVRTDLTGYVQSQVADAEQRLQTHVATQQETLRQDLLRTDGPILGLQRSLDEVSGRIGGVQTALDKKADITMIGRFLPQ